MKDETIKKINKINANLKEIEVAVAHWLDEYTEPDCKTTPPPEGFVDLGMGPVKIHEGDETCWIDVDLGRWSPPSTLNTGEFPNSRYAAKIGSVTAALNGKGPCNIYGYTGEGEEIVPPKGCYIVPKGEPLQEGDQVWSRYWRWKVEIAQTDRPAKISGTIRAYARRKQPETVPLQASDWAGGPWWVKQSGSSKAYFVTEVDLRYDSVCVGEGPGWLPLFLAKNCRRSTDLINWQPCTKEAK